MVWAKARSYVINTSRLVQTLCRRRKSVAVNKFDSEYAIAYKLVDVEDKRYCIPTYAEDRPAARRFLSGEIHEPATHCLVQFVFSRRSGNLIHAGTFFGDMLPNFSSFVSGSVYSFEPVLENYVLAKICVGINRLKNVLLFNVALSDKAQSLYIRTRSDDDQHLGGASTIDESGDLCSATRIDDLIIDEVVMIHLDIEGHELPALQGAMSTIKKFRPILAIEDNKKNCGAFLASIGYERVLDLPTLSIWIPGEAGEDMKLISEFKGRLSSKHLDVQGGSRM